ncbi:hypothetical protein ACIQUZ_22365 [Streptomyces griseus]|uniref:hypothetical protein n=1 Tax=Streptomyces griseus TaxID=1911 RepID=UPI00380841C4
MEIDVSGGLVLVDGNPAEVNGTLVFDTPPKSHQKRVLRTGPSLAARIGRHWETLPGGCRLGHSNASVTARHYARPVAGRDERVADASDFWLNGHDHKRTDRGPEDDDGSTSV